MFVPSASVYPLPSLAVSKLRFAAIPNRSVAAKDEVLFRGKAPADGQATEFVTGLKELKIGHTMTITSRGGFLKKSKSLCELQRMNDGLALTCLAVKVQVSVNGQTVPKGGQIRLESGDRLTLSNVEFIIPGLETIEVPRYGLSPIAEAAVEQTRRFYRENILGADEKIRDGFRFPSGYSVTVDDQGLLTQHSPEEILVADRLNDPVLAAACGWARELRDLPLVERLDAIALKLSSWFWTQKKEPDKYPNRAMLLGEIINGGRAVCRHYSLLTKMLCDEAEIPVELHRGFVRVGGKWIGHAWNMLILPKEDSGGTRRALVDIANGRVLREGDEGWENYVDEPKKAGKICAQLENN